MRTATRPADPIAWERTLPVRPSSVAWRAAIKAAYGTPLDANELEVYRKLSGGLDPLGAPSLDLMVDAGRRGGKSETVARLAVFEALFGGHQVALAPGQLGMVAIVAPLREQAQQTLQYIKGTSGLPGVKRHVAEIRQNEVEFKTGIVVRVLTADAVAVSGYTLVCVIIDEAAKLPGDEAAVPDREIIASLRPGLAPVRGAPPRRFIAITSAYLDDGWAYDTEKACFGKPDAPTLVLRGSTELFNPNIDREWLAKERRRSPREYAREYECEWQASVTESWFGDGVIDGCIDPGRTSSPRQSYFEYLIAIDAAFKSDAFAVAIAHAELRDKTPVAILDKVAVWQAPRGGVLGVESTVEAVATLARAYGATSILADQHAATPLAETFARYGIRLIETPWTAQSKPARFRRVRDGMVDGLVRLPDDGETVKEFRNIQGRLLRSGGEQIEARRGHDDRVSAAVLALSEAMQREARRAATGDYGSISDKSDPWRLGGDDPDEDDENPLYRHIRLYGVR